MNESLQAITKEQAEKFVLEDLARFQQFGYDSKALLIFNETQNTYHLSNYDGNYTLIGTMKNKAKTNYQI